MLLPTDTYKSSIFHKESDEIAERIMKKKKKDAALILLQSSDSGSK